MLSHDTRHLQALVEQVVSKSGMRRLIVERLGALADRAAAMEATIVSQSARLTDAQLPASACAGSSAGKQSWAGHALP